MGLKPIIIAVFSFFKRSTGVHWQRRHENSKKQPFYLSLGKADNTTSPMPAPPTFGGLVKLRGLAQIEAGSNGAGYGK